WKKKPPVPVRALAVIRQSQLSDRLTIAGAPQQQIEFLLNTVHGFLCFFQSFGCKKLEQFSLSIFNLMLSPHLSNLKMRILLKMSYISMYKALCAFLV
ncbi:MAG: hypothetical protein IKX48_13310, partial [Victivallales bacterium]|nr:hypothetical protein [Victivallales bacterium]